MGSLFPRLPDEIGWQCLLRVELNSHHNLRCVCKSWNAALKNPHFYQERKRLKISEQRICMLENTDRGVVYDLAKNSCRSLPPIPARILGIRHCHFVKQKLILITDLPHGNNSVWLYDFSHSKWRQGTKMPKSATRFASAADEHGGLIYVAGGYDWSRHRVRRASVYNMEEDKWDFLPDMNTDMAGSTGVFADGKFYVVDSALFGFTFEVFDSYTRSWKSLENRFNGVCFLSVFGRFYSLCDRGVIEYDYSQDKLHIVGPHPMEEWKRIIFATQVGHNIFVSSLDHIQGQTFCMLAPPSETGGAFKWIGIERPSGLQGCAIGAATVDL
ncbi:hypothetical protein SUGI_0881430 [Cryptomeria japonica]|uniref:F-box/kelch-repeat protein At1g80440 n=1 Tax=Cryptomeria japonica TaxID=3369 RepID=UPI002414934F|nr:F-box/kelch-repeat protein At1g80440 [Cryptomeria japonica]GLJ42518.1 hypothetical protein SUGI_0881430 [Cryptomeria japonica]